MSFNNQQQQQQQQLQERVRLLEQQLTEKDEAYFELSATMASIEAESSYTVKTMEKKTKLQLDRTCEELRRTTQEANQAHMALARLQQHQHAVPVRHSFEHPTAPVNDEKPPTTIFITASSKSPASTAISHQNQYHPGQTLARHLLLQGPIQEQDSTYCFLQHAQHSYLQDTEIVWQILQSSHENSNFWLKEALLWSATSRSLLRQACCSSVDNSTSTKDITMALEPRIRVSADIAVDLQAVAERLRNPLWKPSTFSGTKIVPPSTTKSNPFDPRLCLAWMEQVCITAELWCLIAPLLHDCTSAEEQTPWFTLLSKDLMPKWEAFAQGHISSSDRRPRRVHSILPSCNIMSVSSFLESLHLMGDIFKNKHSDTDRRTVMAIMLDLLEYETFRDKSNVKLIVAMLAFLSTLVEQIEGLKLLRTKVVTSDEEMAQSGLGVAILILTVSQLKLEELVDGGELNHHVQEYKMLEMMRNHVIRLFHQVLRHRTNGVCFTSLIDERKHDYLGVCSQILVAPKDRINPSIRTMVCLQMEEIEADREDEEDLKLKQK